MFNGNKLLEKLKKLDELTSIKDVKALTYTMFPGTHCPLMGAALAVRGIKDALLVVVGTEECAYYTKKMAMTKEFGGVDGRCVSIVLDGHDVTFGSIKKATDSFKEIISEYDPSCIFLVTTCIIEIIGDDFDSLAEELSEEYQLPIMAVHTEHFKTEDHVPGIENTITACINLMKQQEKTNVVNILGHRLGRFETTELNKVLIESNIDVGIIIPNNCRKEDIEIAPRAALNIVVNSTALPLAKKMEKKFKTPYVLFEKFVNPKNILEAYNILFSSLNLETPKIVLDKYNEVNNAVLKAQSILSNVKYVYGNTPYLSYEFNSFLTKLNMEPLLLQLSTYTNNDIAEKENILLKNNPYITKTANITPLQSIYPILKPDLYLGSEFAVRLQKAGIALAGLHLGSKLHGFETTTYIIDELIKAYELSLQYKEELKNGVM